MAQRGTRSSKRDVTFPTAVFNLQPVAAGFDNTLAWLTRMRGLRAIGAPVARWSGRLVMHVHEVHRQVYEAARTEDELEMFCLSLRNGGTQDATGVRFQTRWSADSPLFNVKTTEGQWFGVQAGTPGPAIRHAHDEATLLTRAATSALGGLYAGLVVKYLGDEHAYVISPDSHRHVVGEPQSWRSPSEAIAPGLHHVDVAFRSREGGAAIIRLAITNPGRHAGLGVKLAVGQLVGPGR